jgi:hypothetical protein
MPKLGLWIDDELNGQIDQLHAAMKRRLEFRDLKLTKTDVFKMLIRRSIDDALLEHGVIPENLMRMDPEEILEALDKRNDEQRAVIVRRLKAYHPES